METKQFVVWTSKNDDPTREVLEHVKNKIEKNESPALRLLNSEVKMGQLQVVGQEDALKTLLEEFQPIAQIHEDEGILPPQQPAIKF